MERRFEIALAGVGDLPRREGGYDAVVSCLALNFFPHLDAAVEEQLELASAGPAPSFVATLSEGQRESLSANLQESPPKGEDGSIALLARAWAVAGNRA
jgi:hypothetical protein